MYWVWFFQRRHKAELEVAEMQTFRFPLGVLQMDEIKKILDKMYVLEFMAVKPERPD